MFENRPEGFYTTVDPEGEEIDYSDKGFEDVIANFVGIEVGCSKCNSSFPSKSQLHKHLKADCAGVVQATPLLPTQPPSPIPIVESRTIIPSLGSGIAFRGWTYTTAPITLVPHLLPPDLDSNATACLDTGCGVTLIDKAWLLSHLPHQKLSTMSTPLNVRGIGTSKYESAQFATISLYFPGEDQAGQRVYTSIKCELHLVDGLRANILVGNDILSPEGFAINVSKNCTFIGSCGVTITINAKRRGQFLKRKLLASDDNVIPPCSKSMIPLAPVSLPDDRDFMFHPATQANLTRYAHIIDHTTTKILVRNTSDRPLRIPRHQKLGHVVDIRYENCFLADTQATFNSAAFPPKAQPVFDLHAGVSLAPTDAAMETQLNNGVRVYGDEAAVRQISELVAQYPSIWESEGFVQIPPERWIKIHLKPGWESKVATIKPKVYPLGNDSCRLVDETFDEMHRQGRLKFTADPTPFSFPVFVVWKPDGNGKKKGRAVVDIRKLNEMVLPDSYPLPLQSEIIANVQSCTNLAVLDAASFFYQWLLHPDHRFMFTVVTYRGQETFQVPIMGYINSVAYVQREIDNIFRDVRAWARAYIDNIIYGAKSLPDLLDKLRILFDIFLHYNISIKPTKSYLNYPDVGLLGQRVNSLGLTTSEEKLRAIRLLTYPDTLGALEYYLGLTGYLRNYIHFYAQLAVPLQALKTSLLRHAPIGGQQRRAYASKTKLGPPTPQEYASFLGIQDALSRPSILVHHNPEKVLWID